MLSISPKKKSPRPKHPSSHPPKAHIPSGPSVEELEQQRAALDQFAQVLRGIDQAEKKDPVVQISGSVQGAVDMAMGASKPPRAFIGPRGEIAVVDRNFPAVLDGLRVRIEQYSFRLPDAEMIAHLDKEFARIKLSSHFLLHTFSPKESECQEISHLLCRLLTKRAKQTKISEAFLSHVHNVWLGGTSRGAFYSAAEEALLKSIRYEQDVTRIWVDFWAMFARGDFPKDRIAEAVIDRAWEWLRPDDTSGIDRARKLWGVVVKNDATMRKNARVYLEEKVATLHPASINPAFVKRIQDFTHHISSQK